MMQLMLYQINRSAILDLESVETGPSSHPIFLPFCRNFWVFHQVLKILESDQFKDSFMIVLYSFGGVNYQCSATLYYGLCRKRECLLCCLAIMT